MSYDALEKKFRALPQQSFPEVSDFFDYIFYKFGKATNIQPLSDDEKIDESLLTRINSACKKAPLEKISQDATISTMWEAIKNDSW